MKKFRKTSVADGIAIVRSFRISENSPEGLRLECSRETQASGLELLSLKVALGLKSSMEMPGPTIRLVLISSNRP